MLTCRRSVVLLGMLHLLLVAPAGAQQPGANPPPASRPGDSRQVPGAPLQGVDIGTFERANGLGDRRSGIDALNYHELGDRRQSARLRDALEEHEESVQSARAGSFLSKLPYVGVAGLIGGGIGATLAIQATTFAKNALPGLWPRIGRYAINGLKGAGKWGAVGLAVGLVGAGVVHMWRESREGGRRREALRDYERRTGGLMDRIHEDATRTRSGQPVPAAPPAAPAVAPPAAGIDGDDVRNADR